MKAMKHPWRCEQLYKNISDKEAKRHNQVRIIDESGEDYLYPSHFFALVKLSTQIKSRNHERTSIANRQQRNIVRGSRQVVVFSLHSSQRQTEGYIRKRHEQERKESVSNP